jgi:hypothetical protein
VLTIVGSREARCMSRRVRVKTLHEELARERDFSFERAPQPRLVGVEHHRSTLAKLLTTCHGSWSAGEEALRLGPRAVAQRWNAMSERVLLEMWCPMRHRRSPSLAIIRASANRISSASDQDGHCTESKVVLP